MPPHTTTDHSDAAAIEGLDGQLHGTWTKYEEVAMHFNDLIMRWRLQAVGGLAALVTLGGSVVSGVDAPHRYWGMLLLATTFLCLWAGVAIVDLFYYRKLLTGAVAELVQLEKQLPIKLSTTIEHHANCGGRIAPFLFYSAGFFPLVLIFAYAGHRLACPAAESAARATHALEAAGAARSLDASPAPWHHEGGRRSTTR